MCDGKIENRRAEGGFPSKRKLYAQSSSRREGRVTDLEEDALFNNDDKGEFYRAALREFARLVADGKQVTYSDTEADEV